MRFPFPRLVQLAFTAALWCGQIFGSEIVLRPSGKLLFQPQLLWSNSDTTLQGTGYIIEHRGKFFGVTSIHFLDFDAGGLRAATWLDVYSEMPLATFRASLGRPARTTISQPKHVADDFLLLPLTAVPEQSTALQLEQVERYSAGTRLWFPNKSRDVESGYEWIDATVLEDLGYLIKAKLRDPIVIQSQSGSPLLNADTGKVVGMVQGGEEENGKVTLTLCPARSLVKFLSRPQQTTALLTSIRRRR
jgi:hypothetical protein